MANWLKIICAGTKVEWLSKYLWTFYEENVQYLSVPTMVVWAGFELNWNPYVFFLSFFFYLLHSIFQPFNYCGWHLIHLCSLKDIYWSKGILQNEYEPAFSIFCLHAFCCPLHRFFSLPLPHLHLFYYFFLFAPLFALCALEWSPCTGMASWGELVKHLLQPLQFCVILASTEPLMLGL